jgi:hypothetical protein
MIPTASAEEPALIAPETIAEVIRGPVRYPGILSADTRYLVIDKAPDSDNRIAEKEEP